MGAPNPAEMTATETAAAVARGDLSCEEVVRACLDQVDAREATVQAFAYLDPDLALASARRIDQAPVKGPMAGVTFAVKDIIDTADQPTQYNSPIYTGFQPARDAACVALVRAAGAVIIGKAVTTEFAFSHPGPTTNPHDPKRTPGGSSSGSAASVAAGMSHMGFGTQTGGSTIRPASFCGIYGIKPTFNLVGRDGVKPLGDTLDTIGWYGRSADDLALGLAVLTAAPPRDLASLARGSLRIGRCITPRGDAALPETVAAIDAAANALAAAGHVVEDVALPDGFEPLYDDHQDIMAVEACRSFRRENVLNRDLLSTRMQQLIDDGLAVTPEREMAARGRTGAAKPQLDRVFDSYDLLLTPSATGEAPGGLSSTGDSVFNRLWTLLHVPCVTIPAAKGPNGLPVGVQLVGRRYDDWRLLGAARQIAEILLPA